MRPSRHDTSDTSAQLVDATTDISTYQESPPIEWLRKAGAGGALFIGTNIDQLIIGCTDYRDRLSLPALSYSSYSLPPRYLLCLADVVYVFDVDDPRRLRQLAWCCALRRLHPTRPSIFGYSHHPESESTELVQKVTGYGARFFPLFGYAQ